MESPPVPMMTHPLNDKKLHPLSSPFPVKSLQQSPAGYRNQPPQPPPQPQWFTIPEGTPHSPLTARSEPASSSKGDDMNQRDSISELDHEGQSSPESYLECSHEQQQQQPKISHQEAEDPLWYNPRDSVEPSDQPEIELMPLPYEMVSKPLSPQRNVKWKDMERKVSQPLNVTSPHLSERSSTSVRMEEGSGSAHSSTHSLPRPASRPLISTLEQHHGIMSRTMSDRALPPLPRPQGGSQSLHRPLPTFPPRPAMSRTVSDNLPHPRQLPNIHQQVTRRASESYHAHGQQLEQTYPPSSSPSPQVFRVSSASAIPQRPVRHKSSVNSLFSGQHGSNGTAHHSNGPDRINQVIRLADEQCACLSGSLMYFSLPACSHADGSETVQSLV